MYRQIMREQVIYGHFREYLEVVREMVAYNNSKGWTPMVLFGPLTGANNDMVYHADYPTLADLEREMKEVMGDATFMGLVRRQAAHVVQGSSITEILMTIDDVA
jgi:hypothetical protein